MKWSNLWCVAFFVALGSIAAQGSSILGTGTGALVGGDLTDPEDDGIEGPGNGMNFNATFFANSEPGFNAFAGSEGAFNVFDNSVGGGQNKWCCGSSSVMPVNGGPGMIVGAREFSVAYQLTGFTVTSGNDVPARDPALWRIEGSNDTTTGLDGTWTTIYNHNTGAEWTARNQVIRYSPADGDPFMPAGAFSAFRMVTTETRGGGTSGAFFQFNELELFGQTPEPATCGLLVLAGLSLAHRRRLASA